MRTKTMMTLGYFGILLLIWQAAVQHWQVSTYMLPSPGLIAHTFIEHAALIGHHLETTAWVIACGFLVSLLLGFISALLMYRFAWVQRMVFPWLLLSQAIPLLALAPLMIMWMGYGLPAQVVITTLVIFFPITMGLYNGLRQTPAAWLTVAKTLGASPWQQMMQIAFPHALRYVVPGLKMAAIWAPVGALIAEWVGASRGIGVLMLLANAQFDTPLLFAAVLALLMVALTLYVLVHIIVRWAFPGYGEMP